MKKKRYDIKMQIISRSRKIDLNFFEDEEISVRKNGNTKTIITGKKIQDGEILCGFKTWNNLLHNTKGPAYTFNMSGDILTDQYYICGIILEKEEWENIINNKEYILSRIRYKYYFRDQKLHREDGPAIDGPHKKYWIYGQEVSKEEWEEFRAKRWEIKEKRREIKVDTRGLDIETEKLVCG